MTVNKLFFLIISVLTINLSTIAMEDYWKAVGKSEKIFPEKTPILTPADLKMRLVALQKSVDKIFDEIEKRKSELTERKATVLLEEAHDLEYEIEELKNYVENDPQYDPENVKSPAFHVQSLAFSIKKFIIPKLKRKLGLPYERDPRVSLD